MCFSYNVYELAPVVLVPVVYWLTVKATSKSCCLLTGSVVINEPILNACTVAAWILYLYFRLSITKLANIHLHRPTICECIIFTEYTLVDSELYMIFSIVWKCCELDMPFNIVVWPIMSCDTDWWKRDYVMLVIIAHCTLERVTMQHIHVAPCNVCQCCTVISEVRWKCK